jgi:hypothetical protein
MKLYLSFPSSNIQKQYKTGLVEYFLQKARKWPRSIQCQYPTGMVKKVVQQGRYCLLDPERPRHCLTRGTYFQYVSTTKWRERRLACPILKGGPSVFNIPKLYIRSFTEVAR